MSKRDRVREEDSTPRKGRTYPFRTGKGNSLILDVNDTEIGTTIEGPWARGKKRGKTVVVDNTRARLKLQECDRGMKVVEVL